MPGARLRADLITPKELTAELTPESPSPKPGRVRPRSVSAGESAKPSNLSIAIPPPATLQPVEPTTDSEPEEQRVHPAQSPAAQIHFSSPPEVYYPHNSAQLVYPLQSPTAYAFPQFDESTPMHYQYPAYPYMYSPVESHFPHASMHNYHYPAYPTSPPMVHAPAVDYPKRMTQHHENIQSPIVLSPVSPVFQTPTASNTPTRSSIAPRHQNQKSHHSMSTLHVRAPGVPPPPVSEKNQLDLKKIEQGLDTRTTVMIKNIPNKMSDKDLLSFIAKVCPRRIDFMYLRMDFQNGEFDVVAVFLEARSSTAGNKVATSDMPSSTLSPWRICYVSPRQGSASNGKLPITFSYPFFDSLQEYVLEREGSSNVLCQLPGQGSVDREVQELVHHGRAGVLPP